MDLRAVVAAGEAGVHSSGWASRFEMKQALPGIIAEQRNNAMTGINRETSELGHLGISPSDALGIKAFTGVSELKELTPEALQGWKEHVRSTARKDVMVIMGGRPTRTDGHATLQAELQARGADVRVLSSSQMRVRGGQLQHRIGGQGSGWQNIAMPEAVVSRGAHTRLVQAMEKAGVHVTNPSALRPVTLDKGLQADILGPLGIHPQTIKGLHTVEDVRAAAAKLPAGPNGEFVVKKVNGHGGEGTWVVRSQEQLDEIAAKHFPPVEPGQEPHEMLAQQYLELGSSDYRVSVVRDVNGKPVVRSVHHRQGQGDDGLANGPQGSKYTRVPLHKADPELKRVAIAANEALGKHAGTRGMDWGGIDVVKASDGNHYVLEVNGTGGIPEHDVPLPRHEHNVPYVADWAVWGKQPKPVGIPQ